MDQAGLTLGIPLPQPPESLGSCATTPGFCFAVAVCISLPSGQLLAGYTFKKENWELREDEQKDPQPWNCPLAPPWGLISMATLVATLIASLSTPEFQTPGSSPFYSLCTKVTSNLHPVSSPSCLISSFPDHPRPTLPSFLLHLIFSLLPPLPFTPLLSFSKSLTLSLTIASSSSALGNDMHQMQSKLTK